MITDLWRVLAKIDTPRLHSVRWYSTTVGRIAKRIGDSLLWSSNVLDRLISLQVVSAYKAKKRTDGF